MTERFKIRKIGHSLAVLALFVAVTAPFFWTGCGESNVNIDQPPPPPGAPGTVPTNIQINMTQVFTPTPIAVKIDVTNFATVVFQNNETEDHRIIAFDGEFDSGVINPGETRSITVDVPGDYPYYCGVHPDRAEERGTLRVLAEDTPPSPTPSPSALATPPSPTDPRPSPSFSPIPN